MDDMQILADIMIIVIIVLGIIMIAITGCYILECSAINNMHKAIKEEGSLLAWIPVVNIWLYGYLADCAMEDRVGKKYNLGLCCTIISLAYLACIVYGFYYSYAVILMYLMGCLFNLIMALTTYTVCRKFWDSSISIAFGLVSIVGLGRLLVMICTGDKAKSYYLNQKEDKYL